MDDWLDSYERIFSLKTFDHFLSLTLVAIQLSRRGSICCNCNWLVSLCTCNFFSRADTHSTACSMFLLQNGKGFPLAGLRYVDKNERKHVSVQVSKNCGGFGLCYCYCSIFHPLLIWFYNWEPLRFAKANNNKQHNIVYKEYECKTDDTDFIRSSNYDYIWNIKTETQ